MCVWWAKSLTKMGGFRVVEPSYNMIFFSEIQYKIDHISKTENWKIDFSFVSVQWVYMGIHQIYIFDVYFVTFEGFFFSWSATHLEINARHL